MFRPEKSKQMTTPMLLLVPTSTNTMGVRTKTYTDDVRFNCNFATYGGTESISNDTLNVIDTAEIVCWYHPHIKSGCRVKRLTDNAVYDIIGEPEDLEMRHMIFKFKIRRVKGGA